MPYTNHEQKLKQMEEWRSTRSRGYHRWLYARRQLRFENAEWFRAAIEQALAGSAREAEEILRAALRDADERAREVGNRYDHERDRPYFVEETLRDEPAVKRASAVKRARKGVTA